MAHTHPVIDDDKEFIIDPVSRVISHPAENQPILIQHDHNSERMTFKIPLSIDGHDLTLCNLIRVHFINISATDIAETCASLYEVDDLKADPEDSTQAVFSWLIAQEATMYVGTLSFLVEFACVNTSTKIIDYSWHTGIYDGIIISNGMDNSEAVIGNRYDVLDTWLQQFKNELMKSANDASSIVKAASVKAQEDIDAYADEVKENLAVDVLTARGYLTDARGTDGKKVMSQLGVDNELKKVESSIATVSKQINTAFSNAMSRIEGVFAETKILGDPDKINPYINIGITIVGPAVRLELGINDDYYFEEGFLEQLPYGISPHEVINLCVSTNPVEVSDNVFEYDNAYLTIDTNGTISYSVVREYADGSGSLPAIVRFLCHTEKSEYSGGLFELMGLHVAASSHRNYTGISQYDTAGDAVRAQIDTLWGYLDSFDLNIRGQIDQAKWNAEDYKKLDDATNDRIDKNSKRLTNIEKSLNPESFEIDDTVAYIKDVPEDVLPRALINKVGGISKKCTNLFNPQWLLDANTGVTITDDGYYDGTAGWYHDKYSIDGFPIHEFEENTAYTIRYKGYIASEGSGTLCVKVNYTDGTYAYSPFINTTAPTDYVFVTNPAKSISMMSMTFGSNGKVYIKDVFIAEGADAQYEPFFSGLRDVKVTEVKSVGRNLIPYPYYDFSNDSFNISGVTGIIEKQVIRISGTSTSAFERRLNKVDLIAGNTYTIYANQSSEYTRVYLRKNGELDRSIAKGNDPYSFTVNSGETYSVYILVLGGYTYNNDTIAVMLNEGPDALPYEPYVEHTFQIPAAVQALPGYGIGISKKYNNYIEWNPDEGTANLRKCVGMVDMGTLSWQGFGGNYAHTGYIFKPNGNVMSALSSLFDSVRIDIYGALLVTFEKGRFTSTDDVKTALSGVMLYYELEKPDIVDITDKITPDNIIDVTGGGTITAVNEHNDPAFVEMVYQHEEV